MSRSRSPAAAGSPSKRARLAFSALQQPMDASKLLHVIDSLDLFKLCNVRDKSALVEEGVARALTDACKVHVNDLHVTIECLKSLRVFLHPHAECRDLRPKVFAVGAGEAAVQALKVALERAEEEKLAETAIVCACTLIWNLASDDDRAPLVQLGAGERIIEALSWGKSKPEVALACCGALRNLASEARNSPVLYARGAGELLVQVCEVQLQDSEIMWHACGALSNLAIEVKIEGKTCNNQVSLCRFGVGEAVIAAMKQHAKVAKLQVKACLCLWHLAQSPQNARAMAGMGAGAALVECLRTKSEMRRGEVRFGWENAEIAFPALSALGCLLQGAEARSQVAALDFCHEAIRALRLNDFGVEFVGCHVLGEMAFEAHKRRQLMDAGACDWVIKVGKRVLGFGGGDMAVVRDAAVAVCRALHQLALLGENQIKMWEKGAVGVLVGLARKWRDRVAEGVCGCLLGLSVDKALKKRVWQAAGKVVVELVKEHGAVDGNVAKWGCGALRNMAAGGVAEDMMAAGVGKLVVGVMRNWAGQREVAWRAVGLVRALAQGGSDLGALGAVGAVKSVVEVLGKVGLEDGEVARECVRAVELLAADKTNAHLLCAAGAVQLVRSVREFVGGDVCTKVGELVLRSGGF